MTRGPFESTVSLVEQFEVVSDSNCMCKEPFNPVHIENRPNSKQSQSQIRIDQKILQIIESIRHKLKFTNSYTSNGKTPINGNQLVCTIIL